MPITRSSLATAAALALLAAGPAAAASSSGGIYAGDIAHDPPDASMSSEDIFKGSIVLTVSKQRLRAIYVETRVFCADGTVSDVRITKDPRGKGPKVGTKGALTYTSNGITVQARIIGNRAEGSVRATAPGDCSGSGSFSVKKRPGS